MQPYCCLQPLAHSLRQTSLRALPGALETVPRGGCGDGHSDVADEWRRWQLRRHEWVDLDPQQSSGQTHRTPKLARLEAVLFVADGPLTLRRIIDFATLADASEARRLINELNECYEQDGAAFRIERVASGYQMLTLPIFADWLDRLHQRHAALKLSPPAMETLTIVAYRQPIIRADIEAIRGVQSTEMLKQLMERGLIRIGGEDDSLGRPYLYVTTRRFLEMFGLKSLDELPMAESLRRPANGRVAHQDTPEAEMDSGEDESADSGTDADAADDAAPETSSAMSSEVTAADVTAADRDAAA